MKPIIKIEILDILKSGRFLDLFLEYSLTYFEEHLLPNPPYRGGVKFDKTDYFVIDNLNLGFSDGYLESISINTKPITTDETFIIVCENIKCNFTIDDFIALLKRNHIAWILFTIQVEISDNVVFLLKNNVLVFFTKDRKSCYTLFRVSISNSFMTNYSRILVDSGILKPKYMPKEF